ncbi:hypothetical protein TcasGA2_TC006373 [Tribolium castaneum]|uniref:Uncharacterized protein n=1 Tax=Tribolium castaneum TaxID=7070 RepID=D6WWE3_TRICA|nr:hypothetical protein TcasGA2_TC006373 [Tribolium castaneum]
MENPKETTEKFIKNEAYTELDAIHPRFMEPQDAQVVRDYEIQHHFYCDECKLFFAPTFRALKTHFDGEMVRHKPYASCFYCQGSVFEYKFKNERKLFHDCKHHRKKDEDTSD